MTETGCFVASTSYKHPHNQPCSDRPENCACDDQCENRIFKHAVFPAPSSSQRMAQRGGRIKCIGPLKVVAHGQSLPPQAKI